MINSEYEFTSLSAPAQTNFHDCEIEPRKKKILHWFPRAGRANESVEYLQESKKRLAKSITASKQRLTRNSSYDAEWVNMWTLYLQVEQLILSAEVAIGWYEAKLLMIWSPKPVLNVKSRCSPLASILAKGRPGTNQMQRRSCLWENSFCAPRKGFLFSKPIELRTTNCPPGSLEDGLCIFSHVRQMA